MLGLATLNHTAPWLPCTMTLCHGARARDLSQQTNVMKPCSSFRRTLASMGLNLRASFKSPHLSWKLHLCVITGPQTKGKGQGLGSGVGVRG